LNDTERKPIIVLGGTGHYGRYIVRNLLARGALVRVLSRSASNARKLLGESPEIVEGDIVSKTSISQALDGVRAVVISVSAFSPKSIRSMRMIERDAVLQVIAQAERMGVARVIYVSIYDIRLDMPGGFDFALRKEIAQIKLDVEQALTYSNFNWTVLGAPPSMEMFFRMIRGSSMMVPGGGPPALPCISPVDMGEIAAQAVERRDLSGLRFRMAGPDAVSFEQAAQRISRVVGRQIRYRKIPMVLPKIVHAVTRPFTSVSDLALFVYSMTGFVQLLNRFPQDLVDAAPADHQRLLDTFDYTRTTLEMEAQRRVDKG